ncbi:hypothetical protein J4G52_25130 [Burkholderia cenocepacia]|uniref:hypothetical protein n=1 Tax=Burkholderia cenocepacia TaxID=95486 RepID=UPI001AA10075|nr:hypothetical protein [Burkholderia cenocepacia]MBO1856826.1 hypothetical protein [Burkholderia cenocepacia]
MQTQLKLVSAPQTPCAASRLARSTKPTVLTDDFITRLTNVTSAERSLRAMGICVLSVHWAHPLPVIRIRRDRDISLKPVLEEISKLNFEQPRDGGYDVWGVYHGVVVCWKETVHELAAASTSVEGGAQ